MEKGSPTPATFVTSASSPPSSRSSASSWPRCPPSAGRCSPLEVYASASATASPSAPASPCCLPTYASCEFPSPLVTLLINATVKGANHTRRLRGHRHRRAQEGPQFLLRYPFNIDLFSYRTFGDKPRYYRHTLQSYLNVALNASVTWGGISRYASNFPSTISPSMLAFG